MENQRTLDTFLQFNGIPQCFVLGEDYVSPKHWQKEIEIAYVTGGWIEISVEDKMYHIDDGQMLFINGGVLHYYGPKKECARVVVVKFAKETVLVQPCNEQLREEVSKLYNQMFLVSSDAKIGQIITDIELAPYQKYNEYYYSAKLVELTLLLLIHPELIFNRMETHMVNNARHLDAALSFLNDNFSAKLTLSMLASHLGLAESYCSKYIKDKTGMTFVEYLNALRVNRAELCLIRSDMNITEIAYHTGFSSVQTFNRVFKALKSVSPTEYRRLRMSKKHQHKM